MNAKDYEKAMRAEIERWMGASIAFTTGGKHNIAVITVNGVTRKSAYPQSPSDSQRGLLNALACIRRTLRDLGAQEIERPASRQERTERRHKPAPQPLRLVPGERAERPDRFYGPLAAMRIQMGE